LLHLSIATLTLHTQAATAPIVFCAKAAKSQTGGAGILITNIGAALRVCVAFLANWFATGRPQLYTIPTLHNENKAENDTQQNYQS
jgi:hypothetical protein